MMDSRWGKRINLRAPVVLRSANGDEAQGEIHNLGNGGLYVATGHPDRITTCVVVGLISGSLPATSPCQVAALVVHRQSGGVGLMLPEGAAQVISALCHDTKPSQRAVAGGTGVP